MPDTDVLVVGGGPVGLALAGDLGWRGINCMLVEATDGEITQPKMDGVNVRTMEFCRRWGIVDVVKSCPYPPSYPQDMVYLTSMTGFELGREAFQTPSGGVEDRLSGPSPEVRVRCPQNMFDPILRGFARSHPTVSLCYETEYIQHTQDETVVTATLRTADGDLRTVTANWLVACRKFSISITALSASTTRKYSTALTLTETLSRVMRSCPGISMTIVRKSTRTIC